MGFGALAAFASLTLAGAGSDAATVGGIEAARICSAAGGALRFGADRWGPPRLRAAAEKPIGSAAATATAHTRANRVSRTKHPLVEKGSRHAGSVIARVDSRDSELSVSRRGLSWKLRHSIDPTKAVSRQHRTLQKLFRRLSASRSA